MEFTNIIRLSKKHIASAGIILGMALKDDPISIHVLPDSNERILKLKHGLQAATCVSVRYGEAYASSENLEGVANWIPYETFEQHKFRLLMCGIKSKIYKIGLKAAKRFKPIEEYSIKMHKKHAPGKHWYLMTLGVEPKFQGKGIGTSLVSYKLKEIDLQGLPAYLETSTEKNVEFYEKMGFHVAEEALIPETEVRQYYMLREVN
jgi:ribosomal protein S18 acetylase RimI-like enzyme